MSTSLHAICVFCGSADGLDQRYTTAAGRLGAALAKRGFTLVYGAGRTGMMGALAQGCLGEGGEVVGVVPQGLDSPQLIFTNGLTRLEVVPDIQMRKARMMELADAFITLPGGYGTLDELFEVLTWSQIGNHRKPLGFLNVNGYFDHLLSWIQRAFEDHFIYKEHLELFVSAETVDDLLDQMRNYRFPDQIERWLVREE
jgi:uncharacterized protein (TIGR00730 family)